MQPRLAEPAASRQTTPLTTNTPTASETSPPVNTDVPNMTTRSSSATPASTDELLARLCRSRLLDEEQARRLTTGWPSDLSPADAAEQLVQAGLLTPYQAEQVL